MAQGTASLSDIWRSQILADIRPGGNLQRATFSRASAGTYVQHSGVGASATTNTLRVEWVDLDGDGFRETPGYLLEGARTQLVTDPENFGNWTVSGTVTRTGGQTDPFGGTAAYLLDSNGGSSDFIWQTVTFTGNATKTIAMAMRGATSTKSMIQLFGAADRHSAWVTWSGGVPTLSTVTGTGVLFSVVSLGNLWYQVAISADGVVAADTNTVRVFPDRNAGLGTVYVFGANAWNAPFPASYQGPSLASRSADVFTLPLNHGVQNCTVMAWLARPSHADAGASTDLGLAPGVCGIGTSAPTSGGQLRLSYQQTARNVESAIDTPTTDRTATAAVASGTQILCAQFRNLTTGGLTKVDAGGGFGSESAAATGFLSFNGTTLQIGRTASGSELFGVLLRLLVVQGLKTRQEMKALAGIA